MGSGIYIIPSANQDVLFLSGGTVTGNTYFSSNLSANTFFSGNTNLQDIFVYSGSSLGGGNSIFKDKTNNILRFKSLSASSNVTIVDSGNELIISSTSSGSTTVIRNGLNTYTGGSLGDYTVNISAATLSGLTVNGNAIITGGLTGGTIYSGGTDISTYFGNLQTQVNTKVNRSGDTMNGQLNVPNISATTITGYTFYSAGTDISTYFNALNAVQGNYVKKSGDTMSGQLNVPAVSATTLTGYTIFSGSTDVSTLFTSASVGLNLSTQINNKVNRSGDTMTGQLSVPTISATTITGYTIFSANTNLQDIFVTSGRTVGNGFPIFTGKSGNHLYFRSISAGTDITIVTGDTIIINSIPGSDSAILVNAATTAALTPIVYDNGSSGISAVISGATNGALASQDGVALAISDLLLVKNQTAQTQNGLYSVTNPGSVSTRYILTRSTMSDETSEFDPQLVFVGAGTTQKGQYYRQVTADPVVGTDNIVYDLLGSGTTALFVTQLNTGAQTNGQIPNWTGLGRQLSKGDQNFLRNPITLNVGVFATTPLSRLDVGGSFGAGSVTGVTANTVLTISHKTVLASAFTGNITITLPAASGCTRREYTIKKVDSTTNTVTLSGETNTIDNASTVVLSSQWNTITVVSDGVNYFTTIPITRTDFLALSGGTVTGNTYFSSNLSANTFSSGNTNLQNIFVYSGSSLGSANAIFVDKTNGILRFKSISAGTNITIISDSNTLTISASSTSAGSQTNIQNGLNTYTGGTASSPTVNISAATLSGLTVNGNANVNGNLSGQTIFSGGTELQTVIYNISNVSQFWTSGATISSLKPRFTSNLLNSTYTTIAGGNNNSAFTNSDFSFIGGGFLNSISGISTYYSSKYSSIIGGRNNKIYNVYGYSNVYSIIGGGKNNKIKYRGSLVGVGNANLINSIYGLIVGGGFNAINGIYGSIVNGVHNTVGSSRLAFIGSGYYNVNNGTSSFIGNGSYSTIINGVSNSFIGIGYTSSISGNNSAIINGTTNAIGGVNSFIGNGQQGLVSGNFSSILNGVGNLIGDGKYSTIVGGKNNQTSGNSIFIGSGTGNTSSGNYSFIGNGFVNVISANSIHSFIGSGSANTISGNFSFLGGGKNNTITSVAGTIAGGRLNRVIGNYGVVVGGRGNSASTVYTFVGGGKNNIASGNYSSVLGGKGNSVSGVYAIVGGNYNIVTGNTAVSFGSGNNAFGLSSTVFGKTNTATGSYSSIGGGRINATHGTSSGIFAGALNTVSSNHSAILGGKSNTIHSTAGYSFVGGGFTNIVSGQSVNAHSFVGGGLYNSVFSNYSAIVGGITNTINGSANGAVILGGAGLVAKYSNTALMTKLQIADPYTNGGVSNLAIDSIGRVYKNTEISGSSIYSATTNIQNLFVYSGQNIGNNISIFKDKTNNLLRFKSLSAGTNISITDSGNELIISASASAGSQTNIQDGLNTYTGGTASIPTVNLSSATLTNLTVTGVTAIQGTSFTVNTTSWLASTPLTFNTSTVPQIRHSSDTNTGIHFDGFSAISLHTSSLQRFVITSGGTIGINSSTSNVNLFSNYKLYVSGNSYFGGAIEANSVSATTITGNTIFSAGTDVSTLFTAASVGSNLSTQINNKVNRTGDTMIGQLNVPTFSGGTVSGGTIFSGNTNLNNIFSPIHYTGVTILNFGFAQYGEGDYATTGVTNSNISAFSNIIFKFSASTNHPNIEESILEGIVLKESDIIDGSGFTINAYAINNTWGEYNVIYKIIN